MNCGNQVAENERKKKNCDNGIAKMEGKKMWQLICAIAKMDGKKKCDN